VTEVKHIQRERPATRDLWRQYCDKHGRGNYDPDRHDEDYLATALWWMRSRTAGAKRQESGANRRLRGEIQALCEARRKAQRSQAFDRADDLREMLKDMEVVLDDKRKLWRHPPSGMSGSFREEDE